MLVCIYILNWSTYLCIQMDYVFLYPFNTHIHLVHTFTYPVGVCICGPVSVIISTALSGFVCIYVSSLCSSISYICLYVVFSSPVRNSSKECLPKSCDLDPVPTQQQYENLDVLLPTITNIINTSPASGVVAPDLKTPA